MLLLQPSPASVLQKAGNSDSHSLQLVGITRGQTWLSEGIRACAWVETPKDECLSKPPIHGATKLGCKHRGQEVPLCKPFLVTWFRT